MSVLAAVASPHPPLMVPAVGRGEERKIADVAGALRRAMAEAAALQPETLVLLSPHSLCYSDCFHISPGKGACGDFSRFGAPQVRLEAAYDDILAAEIEKQAGELAVPVDRSAEKDPALDHGSLIPLLAYAETGADYRLVRIGLSGLDALSHYRLGQAIALAAAALGRRVAVIASGDLSHRLKEDGPYGYHPAGPAFDRQVMQALRQADFLSLLQISPQCMEQAGQCGLGSLWIMAGALDGCRVESGHFAYQGPFGVGYGTAFYRNAGEDRQRCFGSQYAAAQKQAVAARRQGEDPCVSWARKCVEAYVRNGEVLAADSRLPAEMLQKKAAVFVSLKKSGCLRGCIGTLTPQRNCLAAEICHNGIAAATEDPRFAPVSETELADIVYSVDILGPIEAVDSPDQLDVKRYGVIVSDGYRQGVLLPDLPGVDTVAEQIAIARQKAGISPAKPIRLSRFEVVRRQ
ncbi:MAG: AmmeMemoRadiSam system protein A [Firmicutes bacterium]|nr:AmmeMemoRadiSam system protein A [Bacillota bacterium]